MSGTTSRFDQLGAKVQRAQRELADIRGVGIADGVRVEVDAQGHLIAIGAPGAEAILAAYRSALADVEPKVEAATRAVVADPLVASMSDLVARNGADKEAARLAAEEAEDRHWDSARSDPLGRRQDR
mgnify:CR=1 FL=1